MTTTIPASFIVIELVVFALFGAALWTAAKSGRRDLITVLAAAVFGFVIEYLFSTKFPDLPGWLQWLLQHQRNDSGDSYTYARFLVMVAGVPLWISLGWGTIIYASLRTSERLGFGFWLVPVADGLLATSLDLALDPIAEALGFWTWHIDDKVPGLKTMFGVPLDNFLGWFMIVSGLSLAIRAAWKVTARVHDALWAEIGAAFVAVLLALVYAMALQAGFDFLYAIITPAGTFMLVFGLGGLATLTRLPWLRRDQPIDPFAVGIVATMQVLLLVLMLTNGVFRSVPALIGFQPLLAFASVLAFAWPSLEQLRAAAAHRHTMPARGTS